MLVTTGELLTLTSPGKPHEPRKASRAQESLTSPPGKPHETAGDNYVIAPGTGSTRNKQRRKPDTVESEDLSRRGNGERAATQMRRK